MAGERGGMTLSLNLDTGSLPPLQAKSIALSSFVLLGAWASVAQTASISVEVVLKLYMWNAALLAPIVP